MLLSSLMRFPLIFVLCLFCSSSVLRIADGHGTVLPVHWSVHEHSPSGVVIGNLRDALASQKFNTSGVEFKFLPKPNQDLGQLSLDGVRGVLKTSGLVPIDREQQCTPRIVNCSLDISVGLIKQLQLIQVLNLQIEVIDINDNSPTFEQHQYVLGLSEASTPGTVIPLPIPTDLDGPKYGIKSYKILSRYSEFELKITTSSSGASLPNIVLVGTVDRERVSNYALTLAAIDGGTPALTGTTSIVVVIDDVNDNAPVFESGTVSMLIAENEPVGSVLTRVVATDVDSGPNAVIDYLFDHESQTIYGKEFSVDQATGDVVLVQSLDYERQTSYRLVLLAVDRGSNPLTGQVLLNVQVSDVNDHAPQITINTLTSQHATADISENLPPGSFVAHLSVFDADSLENGRVTCRMDNEQDTFNLERISDGQFKLTTAISLDYEIHTIYYPLIYCSDAGNPSLSTIANLSVIVIDRNDNAPAFTQSIYNVSIFENNAVNALIVEVEALDLDSGLNGQLVYSLTNPIISPYIYINETTGEIHAKVSLDHEKITVLKLDVRSSDKGSNALHVTCRVIINIIDVNDERPIFSLSSYAFKVSENIDTVESAIGQLIATDTDSYPFNRFSFAIIETTAHLTKRFKVDPLSGLITSLVRFDREEFRLYVLRVRVTDEDNRLLSSDAIVTVDITDVNDNAPIITFPTTDVNQFNISTNVPVGFVIFKVRASDADEDLNAHLIFAFDEIRNDSSQGYFFIDNSTGEVTVVKSLQSFANQEFKLTVVVSDHGSPSLSSVIDVVIYADPAFSVVLTANTVTTETRLWMMNNRMIIIIVVCVSVVIIFILLIAIICLKLCGRKSRGQMYRCRPKDEKIVHFGQHVPYQRTSAAEFSKVPATVDGNTYTGSAPGRELRRLQATAGMGITPARTIDGNSWNETNHCECDAGFNELLEHDTVDIDSSSSGVSGPTQSTDSGRGSSDAELCAPNRYTPSCQHTNIQMECVDIDSIDCNQHYADIQKMAVADDTLTACRHTNCRNVTNELNHLHHNWTDDKTSHVDKSVYLATPLGPHTNIGVNYKGRPRRRPGNSDVEQSLIASRYHSDALQDGEHLPPTDDLSETEAIDAAQLCREIDTLFFDGGVI